MFFQSRVIIFFLLSSATAIDENDEDDEDDEESEEISTAIDNIPDETDVNDEAHGNPISKFLSVSRHELHSLISYFFHFIIYSY